MKIPLTAAGSLLAALAADAATLTRLELEQRLQALEKAPAPAQLSPGAMCYAMMPPDTSQQAYVCPKCGDKTLYARSFADDIDWHRRSVKQLRAKGLDCVLDESAFCKKCGQGVKEKKFVLVVQWPEQKQPHRTVLRSEDDLELLLEFFDGKATHSLGQMGEQPLKNYLPQIRNLLGVWTGGVSPKATGAKKP